MNDLSKQKGEKAEEVEGLRATSPEVIYAEDLETFLAALTAVEEEHEKSIANLVAQQKQALKGRKGPVKVPPSPLPAILNSADDSKQDAPL